MSDVTAAETTLAEHFGDETAAEVVAALAGAGLEVRARRAQDTPSDPAAWAAVWQGEVQSVHMRREDAEAADEDGTMVALPLDARAPGAVAAAPTEDDEPAATADAREALTDQTTHAEGALNRTLDRLDAGWRLVPPALPAGHEDEAAVEQAPQGPRDAHARLYGEPWDEGDEVTRLTARLDDAMRRAAGASS